MLSNATFNMPDNCFYKREEITKLIYLKIWSVLIPITSIVMSWRRQIKRDKQLIVLSPRWENSGRTSSAHRLLVALRNTLSLCNHRHQSDEKMNEYMKQVVITLQGLHVTVVKRKKKRQCKWFAGSLCANMEEKKNPKQTLRRGWSNNQPPRTEEERRGEGGHVLGVLEGVDIFPDLRVPITRRAEERGQQPDAAQPRDPMPIGAWPFSRALCQGCQFDGRCRP